MVIYKITNRLNEKIYVGQTKQPIEKRFLQHSKAQTPLGDAMRQCGLENFTIEVIERCKTQNQLNERERFWIRVLNCKVPNGYNQSDGGEGAHKKIKRIQRRKNSMLMDLNGRSLAEQIKLLATYRGYTLKTLGEEFNKRFGTKYVQQSFSRKINNCAISWEELKQFGEILGFEVKLELVEQTKGGD